MGGKSFYFSGRGRTDVAPHCRVPPTWGAHNHTEEKVEEGREVGFSVRQRGVGGVASRKLLLPSSPGLSFWVSVNEKVPLQLGSGSWNPQPSSLTSGSGDRPRKSVPACYWESRAERRSNTCAALATRAAVRSPTAPSARPPGQLQPRSLLSHTRTPLCARVSAQGRILLGSGAASLIPEIKVKEALSPFTKTLKTIPLLWKAGISIWGSRCHE